MDTYGRGERLSARQDSTGLGFTVDGSTSKTAKPRVPRWAEDGLGNIEDTALYFGVSTKTVRRWVSAGSLRAVRVGPQMLRFRREDVEAFAKTVPTVARRASS